MLDVEGSEFKILNTIDLKKINISEIFFEKKHFDGYMKQGDKFDKIKKKLIENQYEIKNADKENIIAVLKR